MRLALPTVVRPPSQAQQRREAARERAAASRATARIRTDVDASIAEALASLVETDKTVCWIRWKMVLAQAHGALVERGYDRESAGRLLGDRLGASPKRACSSEDGAGTMSA